MDLTTFIILALIVIAIWYAFRKRKNKPQDAEIIFQDSDSNKKHYVIFDIETSGLPKNKYADIDDFENWPHPVQMAWLVFDDSGKIIKRRTETIKQNIKIPSAASQIHGITTSKMKKEGKQPTEIYSEFINDCKESKWLVTHNIDFFMPILDCDLLRNNFSKISGIKPFCTMKKTVNFCKIKKPDGEYKYPKLEELFGILYFNNKTAKVDSANNAEVDATIIAWCFFKLLDKKIISL